jgi:hypothetical protein
MRTLFKNANFCLQLSWEKEVLIGCQHLRGSGDPRVVGGWGLRTTLVLRSRELFVSSRTDRELRGGKRTLKESWRPERELSPFHIRMDGFTFLHLHTSYRAAARRQLLLLTGLPEQLASPHPSPRMVGQRKKTSRRGRLDGRGWCCLNLQHHHTGYAGLPFFFSWFA